MKKAAVMALVASVWLGLASQAGAASITWAQGVVDRGLDQTSGIDANRSCSASVLGAPGEAAAGCLSFLSLGLDTNKDGLGGWVVLDFGSSFDHAAVVFETTYNCTPNPTGGGCVGYREFADVYASNASLGFAGGSGWTWIGTVSNDRAQGAGAQLDLTGPFRYLAVVDTTLQHGGTAGDGFDLEAVGVTAVPEPASIALLGSGLLGLAGSARRRFRK